MKETQILAWCSICWSENEERIEASIDTTFAVGGFERDLQLCEMHGKSTGVADLEAVLEQYGEKVGALGNRAKLVRRPATASVKAAPAGGGPSSGSVKARVDCEWCGTEASEGTSIAAHVRAFHPEHYIEFMSKNALKDRHRWIERLQRGETWESPAASAKAKAKAK